MRQPQPPRPASRRRGLLSGTAIALVGHPTATAGTLVMGAMAAAILTNALAMQPGQHPAPLFQGTRPFADADTADEGVRAPDAVRAEPDPLAALVEDSGGAPAIDSGLVAAIQAELKAAGFYSGAIDGLTGPMTATAILDFERAAGLALVGEPTGDVLAALKSYQPGPRSDAAQDDAPETTAALPPPAAPPAAAAEPARIPLPVPAPRRTSLNAPAPADSLAPKVVRTVRLTPGDGIVDDPVAVPTATPPPDVAAPPADESDPRLAKIQEALDLLGFGPLKATGTMSPATRSSIRRFEENRGLPVTGEINERFLGELVRIGGLSQP